MKKAIEKIEQKAYHVEQGVKQQFKKADDEIKRLIITKIQEPFRVIKSRGLPVEDSLPLLSKTMEEFEDLVIKLIPKEFNSQENLLKQDEGNFEGFSDAWNILHKDSKKFLKTGELLFSYMSKSSIASEKDIDFSPIVIEYCKALENEFVHKIFQKNKGYMANAFEKNHKESYEKMQNDFDGDKLNSELKSAFRTWKKLNDYFSKQDSIPLTIGDMKFIFKHLNNEKVLNEISYLSEFRNKILEDWDNSLLLDREFYKTINEKTSLTGVFDKVANYRNSSAHIGVETYSKAFECRTCVRKNFPMIIKRYKKINNFL